ncbi:beta-propeller domain-containing protein [Melittangium boletus]|uniref:Lipoprotein n=1 Tax=Melittangium boletus DSM 14713 TaxID=1294270 RepID=A0A250IDL5_9BACT|nr:beta-propeller domain-containing protein [Melittangium boletus]ATB29308.1 hypothetical protein MEBOL_002757 [Melittangium boletus DSM 14713]
MHGNNGRKWVVLALAGVAGCSSEEEVIPENQPVQMSARLESFDSCEALESYIEDAAVLDMRATLERSKQYARGGLFGGIPESSPMPPTGDSSNSSPSPSPGSGAGGPSNHTGTNNQVTGVDEADFVKNDGTRLFVLSGQTLYLHRSWPAQSLRAESSLKLEGYPRQMFLHGDQVVVFSVVYEPQPGQGASVRVMSDIACPDLGFCGYSAHVSTKVTTVDVSQLAAPRVVREMYLPGDYQDARLAGGSARVVLREFFIWPAAVRWYPETSGMNWWDSRRMEPAFDKLMAENERIIRSHNLADWLKGGRIRLPDGTLVAWNRDCRDFHRTNAPSRLGFATVASIDLDAAVTQAPGITTLVAQTDLVYATATSLYLSARHWWWWEDAGQTDYSYVHKFELTQPHRAHYVASATIEGQPLNQFSFDEHEGVLRVATTLTRRVKDDSSRWGRTETSSRVATYAQQGSQLALLGQSPELAEGERIFSARFLGDKGYVVTFRQTDPLFTFDLSDPTQPRKVGELKVPGFSTYLHPLGDTHLLAVGEHRAEDGSWNSRSLKVTLFDVSDLAHPREAFTQQVGTSSSGSEALYDHKAFNYFAAKGLLAIPFTDWNWSKPSGGNYWDGFTSELRVFRVSPTTGIVPVGTLGMSDLFRTVNYYQWSYTYVPSVRRSVMADDYVYAITDAGVRVSHVNQLSQPLATTRFDSPR